MFIWFNSSWEKGSPSKNFENVKLPGFSYSMPSKSSIYDYLKDDPVEDSKKIYYKAPIVEPIDEASSSIGSPTYSTMQPLTFSSKNFISKPFEISKDYWRQNFNSIEN